MPALRQLIPIRNFPRSLIQITLQITETPENAYVNAKLTQARLVCTVASLWLLLNSGADFHA